MKPDDNPMRPTERLSKAPRCRANAKSTGRRCKGPAVNGWTVCRMHGARGGAPSGPANGMWRHGNRTQQADQFKSALSQLLADSRQIAKALGNL